MNLCSFNNNHILINLFRAEFCACESDQDFAAKLYAVRLAFRNIMDEPPTMQVISIIFSKKIETYFAVDEGVTHHQIIWIFLAFHPKISGWV